jgi:hypothetical protein
MKSPALLSGMLLFVLSCGSVQRSSEDERLPCQSGHAVLVVHNRGGSVDIVEGRTGSNARSVVALVGPGSHEVKIRNSWAYHYFARRQSDGRIASGRNGSVEIHRECRA